MVGLTQKLRPDKQTYQIIRIVFHIRFIMHFPRLGLNLKVQNIYCAQIFATVKITKLLQLFVVQTVYIFVGCFRVRSQTLAVTLFLEKFKNLHRKNTFSLENEFPNGIFQKKKLCIRVRKSPQKFGSPRCVVQTNK